MKFAVIGGGIAGLSAAYLLSRKFQVDLFEGEPVAGGHARTVDYTGEGNPVPVDTGFLVYNERTYPLLVRLFQELSVPTRESNMSFSVYLPDRELVYNGNGIGGIFFQKKNLFSPAHLRMVRDILRFNRFASRDVETGGPDPAVTLGEYLKRWSPEFAGRYLYPMGSSIWSSPEKDMAGYPARAFLQFFYNHGLLTVKDQPVWRTVAGGSREYVKRILASTPGEKFTDDPVRRVIRSGDKLHVRTEKGREAEYDRVVFATHPPETLKILADADPEERKFLESFRYRENVAILHNRPSGLYRDRRVWASWNYIIEEKKENPPVLSYWINLLQKPPIQGDLFVTLNRPDLENEGLALDRKVFEHPLFDNRAIRARESVADFDERRGLFFAGAWLRHGFHEDGLWSSQRIAERLGCGL